MAREHPENGRCPFCSSLRLHKSGVVYVKDGTRQRFYCRTCHRTTTKPRLQLDLPLDRQNQS